MIDDKEELLRLEIAREKAQRDREAREQRHCYEIQRSKLNPKRRSLEKIRKRKGRK